MKRIVPIFLSLVFVFSVFVFSVSAEGESYYLEGTYTLNHNLNQQAFNFSGEPGETVFISNGTNYNNFSVNNSGSAWYSFRDADGTLPADDHVRQSTATNWYNDAWKTLYFPVPFEVSYETYTYFMINVSAHVPLDCDGTCPFTDANGDSYCDICGGFFTTPLLEMVKPMQGVLPEVLAEVLKILPIGLACSIGYLGLRKALDLLRQILSAA